MADKKTTEQAAADISVVLLQPHTHRRIECAPGEIITLREPQAKALVEAKRARIATESERTNIEKAGI